MSSQLSQTKSNTDLTGTYLLQYHSTELKLRIFYLCLSLTLSFILCFQQAEYLLYKVTSVLLESLNNLDDSKNELIKNLSIDVESSVMASSSSAWLSQPSPGFIFTELLEAFWSTLLLSGYGSFLLSLPVIYYTLYKFLLPGLTHIESRLLKTFMLFSLGFILLAHLLTYYFILPYATSFFLSFQSNYPQTAFLSFTGRIYPVLTFILNTFSIISLLFQLPLCLFFLFIYFDFGSFLFPGTNSFELVQYRRTRSAYG